MNIAVANAFEMGENRDPRFGLDAPDQTFAAPWNDHVDVAA